MEARHFSATLYLDQRLGRQSYSGGGRSATRDSSTHKASAIVVRFLHRLCFIKHTGMPGVTLKDNRNILEDGGLHNDLEGALG